MDRPASHPGHALTSTRAVLAFALAVLVLVPVADAATSPKVVLSGMVVIAPLIACTRLSVRAVAAIGVGAVAVICISPVWNDVLEAQQAVRTGIVAAGSLLAIVVAIVRERIERERQFERLLSGLISASNARPDLLVGEIARALVPRFATAARIELEGSGDLPPHVGEAGEAALTAAPVEEVEHREVAPDPSGGWRFTGRLRSGPKEIGRLRLHRRAPFTAVDRALFDRLADRVALALENAVLLQTTRDLVGRLDVAHRRLQTVIDQMPAAVTIRDREGELTLANRRAQEIRRSASGDADTDEWFAAHPGRRVDGTPITTEDWPHRRSLSTGEVVRAEEYMFQRRDGGWSVAQVHAAPISDSDGAVSAVVTIFDDVTEQHRDRRALRWLAEVGRLLDRPHSAPTRVADVLEVIVADVGDVGLLYRTRPDEGVTLRACVTAPGGDEDPATLRERIRAADNGLGESVEHPAATAARTRTTTRLDASTADGVAGEWLRLAGLTTAALVPVTHTQHTHGCLVLGTNGPGAIDDRDLAVIELVARRVALALENSRLYADQHRVSTALQRDLLPHALPQWADLELATLYRPARGAADVGGDFFDLFDARDAHMLVIGDVSGKGVEAAATTALVRHVVRVAARSTDRNGRLATVNQAMLEDAPNEQFCTLAWAALRADGDAVAGDVACAGHPPPLVVRADGTVETIAATGTLLGFVPAINSDLADVRLEPGETLVLYTDGVSEARLPDGTLLGTEGLQRCLNGLGGATADEILAAIEHELELTETRDDVALVVAGVRA